MSSNSINIQSGCFFQDFQKRWDRQSRAFYNLFRQADRVEKLAEVIERLVGFILLF